jgi:hypothetical protein
MAKDRSNHANLYVKIREIICKASGSSSLEDVRVSLGGAGSTTPTSS